MRVRGGELGVESSGYLLVMSEMSVVECNRLVGGLRSPFPRKGSEKGPEI